MTIKKRNLAKIAMIAIVTVLVMTILACGFEAEQSQLEEEIESLTIAIPYDLNYADFEDSYYVTWLEEMSGSKIEIEYISETYTTDYLNMLFASTASDVDIVFFANDNAPTTEELERYIEQGYLQPVDEYMSEGGYLVEFVADFSDYDLESTLEYDDGHIYYLPSLSLSETQCYLQTAWINVEWLEELGMEIPTTTEELTEVLRAFQSMDEYTVPLIGSAESENTFVCNFLMNSFTTCDPFNYYLALDSDGEVYYPPMTEEWRQGLIYCHELYEEGLLVDENFTYSEAELISICNDPSNVVGMFLAKGLSDIIFDDSPQLLSYYLVVPPLNENGTVTLEAQLPEVGGVILNTSDQKDEAFQLLDLMCSDEAYLISHFGEYEVDWECSSSSDISVLGYPAEITMISSSNLERNPSDATVLGPFLTDVYYADRVAWVGYQVNQSEYLQARAYRTYQNYEPEYVLDFVAYSDYEGDLELLEENALYIKENMIDFIRGVKDVEDDEVWNAYLEELNL